MGEFLHKYNTDNVHSRAVIVGLINLLNSRVHYEQVLSDTDVEIVTVPFIYSMGGDERFLQDYFLHWNDCIHPRMADGNYDVWPRGSVTLTANTINTTAMTHRFVRATYVKEVNGELQRFNAFLNSIPLTMDFDIEVRTDTVLDAFKIQQSIVETFYKVQVFSVNFRGFRVPCQAGFSDDLGIEKTFDFTYQDDNKVGLKFTITVETYYPVTDPTTERNDGNRMANIGYKVHPKEETNSSPPYYIKLTSPNLDETYFSSGIMPIAWVNTGTITSVNIYYQLEGSTNWEPLVLHLANTGFYDWKIPYFNEEGNQIKSDNLNAKVLPAASSGSSGTSGVPWVGRESRIRAIINDSGEVEKIVIFEQGIAYDDDSIIDVSIMPTPYDSTPSFAPPIIQASTNDNGEIIGADIIDPGSGFTQSPTTRILLKIEDAGNSAVFNILSKSAIFIGDITTSSPNQSYITGVNPTVDTLLNSGYLNAGQEITGVGIPSGTEIVLANPAFNRIQLSNSVTQNLNGGTFATPPNPIILSIR